MTSYLTVQDAYEHLVDVFDLDGKDIDRVQRTLRRAVAEAYRRLPSLHNWAWLRRQAMITTTAPYETGTIAYTASTRALTLTDGTWPTDAEFGMVTIDSTRYQVERRNSSTVLTLASNNAPTSNIASGTTYRWVRYTYLLPVDCSDIIELTDPKTLSRFYRQSPETTFMQTEIPGVGRFPAGWSVIPSSQRPGRKELFLTAVPDTAKTLKFLYDVQWNNPDVNELSSGTVSVSVDTDAATFSSSILTEDCVGAVLRISSTSVKPTSPYGVYRTASDEHVTELPQFSRIITAYVSATSCLLDEAVTSAVVTKAFTISSRVDVDQTSVWDLFLRLCELSFKKLTRTDSKVVQLAEQDVQRALREAMVVDGNRFPPTTQLREHVWRPTIIEP